MRPSPPLSAGFVQLFACGRQKCFSVIHCGSFCGKYNKLPMDEDAIRRELEHSGDDEDYLSDLDEEFVIYQARKIMV